VAADLRGPFPALWNVLEYGTCHLGGAAHRTGQEIDDSFDAVSPRGAHQCHGRADLFGQRLGVHVATALGQVVRHVQNHQGRQTEREHRRRQDQVAAEVGRVEDQQNRGRSRDGRHAAQQYVPCYLLVLRARRQAVHAGQVDQRHHAPVVQPRFAYMLFDGDTREIRHLLPQAGKTVVEGGFARVRRTDKGHNLGHGPRLLPYFVVGTGRRAIREAVSARNATSLPSTRKTRGSPPGAQKAANTVLPGRKPSSIKRRASPSGRSRRSRIPCSPSRSSPSVAGARRLRPQALLKLSCITLLV